MVKLLSLNRADAIEIDMVESNGKIIEPRKKNTLFTIIGNKLKYTFMISMNNSISCAKVKINKFKSNDIIHESVYYIAKSNYYYDIDDGRRLILIVMSNYSIMIIMVEAG